MESEEQGGVPPRGWEIPQRPADRPEVESLGALIEQLLALVPEELRSQLVEAVHRLLEVLRALIDWFVARIEQRASAPEVEVRDIPIL